MRRNKTYDRVMSRVYSSSRPSIRSSSSVTRHEIQSAIHVGAKPSVSNVSSSVYSELPTVLNDYVPDSIEEKLKVRSFVSKPRKTVRSMDPSLSPPRPPLNLRKVQERNKNIRVTNSAPSLLRYRPREWSDVHVRQCHSSRSHTKLKDLKGEIRAYEETNKMLKLRSKLYKQCGIVLDDYGELCQDKAIQAEAIDEESSNKRAQRSERKDAGAAGAVPRQQMSTPAAHRYPVDRYLVGSNKNIGKVNILDDDLWNSDPALRPEDEIILRKLQEMLQSTAEDLKLLSREINMNKEPRVHVKSLPTPLDEEFNEKVHIQEIVDAKFHGYKIIEPREKEIQSNLNNYLNNKIPNKLGNINAVDKQINTDTITKKQPVTKLLRQTKIRTLNINGENNNLNNNTTPEKKIGRTTIAYNEYSYKYNEPKEDLPIKTCLKVQHMPSVNIRSELKEQKVLQLDILPESTDVKEVAQEIKKNVSVLSVKHEAKSIKTAATESKIQTAIQHAFVPASRPLRKITQMSTCESSDSSKTHFNKKTQVKPSVRSTPMNTARNETVKNKINPSTFKPHKTMNKNLEAWKKKLNSVYGLSNKSPKKRAVVSTKKKPINSYKSPTRTPHLNLEKQLNNSQYIPYSKLTVGGVRASDIEKEMGDLTAKGESYIAPIIDKILSSRDQSLNEENKVLDTSDEKLLQEVIDLENTVSKTLILNGKANKETDRQPEIPKINVNSGSGSPSEDNYDDDFEDDKSENEVNKSDLSSNSKNSLEEYNYSGTTETPNKAQKTNPENAATDIQNKTFTKALNLSFKNSVDVFEFIHSVDTQDIATQSNTTHKILLKETQTSPNPESKCSSSPPPQIHNDLWPTIDPKGKVEKLFKLEKDLIKQLILEEYGDLLESNISKPSTSNDEKAPSQLHSNTISIQKLTQTSPAKVKSAMTSPKTTKTRMTSPFALSLTVDRQTSPLEANNQDALKIELDHSADDLGISINLSSPRFSLRLPQNSHEVLSNLEICNKTFTRDLKERTRVQEVKPEISKTFTKCSVSSSSSEDFNSSDISSLGEVTIKLRKKLKNRAPTISQSSSSSSQRSSSDLQSYGILPLRSEGEVSLGQVRK